MDLPLNLKNDLLRRKKAANFRTLSHPTFEADFFSNDYLGYSGNKAISDSAKSFINSQSIEANGSSGSRLISGNHKLFEILELKANRVFNTEAALFFNSGYDANIGLLSATLKPKDIIFYDELCHASIRDGLQMSKAKSFKFQHNNYKDLAKKIELQLKRLNPQNIYIITESVFSMDGDQSDVSRLIEISKNYQAYLIIDEAHALGVCGKDYKGLSYEFSKDIFARIYTCGKALGSHGGFVLGSKALKDYLINFSRPFIYTTGASPFHVAKVIASLDYFESEDKEKEELKAVISLFKKEVISADLSEQISLNDTAIQFIQTRDIVKAKALAKNLNENGFGVKAILYPTVPKGKERIRIILHSYNSKDEIKRLVSSIK